MRRALALALLLLLAIGAPTAGAAKPQVSFSDMENEFMCVSCGVALPLAESPQADRERALLRRLIVSGKTKSQVKDGMVFAYTDRVLAQPKSSGFGIFVYLIPVALVVIALLALVVGLPRWRRRSGEDPAADAAPQPELSPADAQLLEGDLARYDV
jgi:cytochrome c-type biogenesis protein CcmH/NrfF